LYIQQFSDLKVLKSNLSALPFPAISPLLDQKLAYLVTMIIQHGKKHEIMQEINTEIFDLFDINAEERNLVMQTV
jgi:hypothetical protein